MHNVASDTSVCCTRPMQTPLCYSPCTVCSLTPPVDGSASFKNECRDHTCLYEQAGHICPWQGTFRLCKRPHGNVPRFDLNVLAWRLCLLEALAVVFMQAHPVSGDHCLQSNGYVHAPSLHVDCVRMRAHLQLCSCRLLPIALGSLSVDQSGAIGGG